MSQPVCTMSWADQPNWPALSLYGPSATSFVACGTSWDAVAVALARGLDALDALRLPLGAGYQVLADYLRHEIYVLVHPGTGEQCAMPGVRVLSRGSWLLVPSAPGVQVPSATWLSTPAEHQRLVPAGLLAGALATRSTTDR